VSLISDMTDKAMQMGIPISVHVDVTYRCNERCEHCYLDHDDKGEMTTQEIKNILDQLAEAGVFFLVFSGGEVFMRRLRKAGMASAGPLVQILPIVV